MVIDPGEEGERILHVAEKAGVNIRLVVNTHGHFDHVSANHEMKAATGAPILIHAEDAPMLKQALEARGVNVAHVSVELEQGDRQNRDPLARHPQGRRRRFGPEEDGEMPLDELTLRPQQWRPWGFEARA